MFWLDHPIHPGADKRVDDRMRSDDARDAFAVPEIQRTEPSRASLMSQARKSSQRGSLSP
jgi:hypothetical protein